MAASRTSAENVVNAFVDREIGARPNNSGQFGKTLAAVMTAYEISDATAIDWLRTEGEQTSTAKRAVHDLIRQGLSLEEVLVGAERGLAPSVSLETKVDGPEPKSLRALVAEVYVDEVKGVIREAINEGVSIETLREMASKCAGRYHILAKKMTRFVDSQAVVQSGDVVAAGSAPELEREGVPEPHMESREQVLPKADQQPAPAQPEEVVDSSSGSRFAGIMVVVVLVMVISGVVYDSLETRQTEHEEQAEREKEAEREEQAEQDEQAESDGPLAGAGPTHAERIRLSELQRLAEALPWEEGGDSAYSTAVRALYIDGEETEEVYRAIRDGAELGHPVARMELAKLYWDGTGVRGNYLKAVNLGRAAFPGLRDKAESGDAHAQYLLSWVYGDDENFIVSQNRTKQARWIRKAAAQGHAFAQNSLGVLFHLGNLQDYEQAKYWYTKAADQGLALAQFNMGLLYANGSGVSRNKWNAVHWYRKAADQGYAPAQYNLGVIYVYGQGNVPRDQSYGEEWLRKAAAQGIERAQEYFQDKAQEYLQDIELD